MGGRGGGVGLEETFHALEAPSELARVPPRRPELPVLPHEIDPRQRIVLALQDKGLDLGRVRRVRRREAGAVARDARHAHLVLVHLQAPEVQRRRRHPLHGEQHACALPGGGDAERDEELVGEEGLAVVARRREVGIHEHLGDLPRVAVGHVAVVDERVLPEGLGLLARRLHEALAVRPGERLDEPARHAAAEVAGAADGVDRTCELRRGLARVFRGAPVGRKIRH
mmetsp:Transcript_36569/g.112695  ORF Transcript_36569/g.112695 Transcript_36569/m.112695 type:complete len:226 (+) Transcript_36569:1196-1873(+)